MTMPLFALSFALLGPAETPLDTVLVLATAGVLGVAPLVGGVALAGAIGRR